MSRLCGRTEALKGFKRDFKRANERWSRVSDAHLKPYSRTLSSAGHRIELIKKDKQDEDHWYKLSKRTPKLTAFISVMFCLYSVTFSHGVWSDRCRNVLLSTKLLSTSSSSLLKWFSSIWYLSNLSKKKKSRLDFTTTRLNHTAATSVSQHRLYGLWTLWVCNPLLL